MYVFILDVEYRYRVPNAPSRVFVLSWEPIISIIHH